MAESQENEYPPEDTLGDQWLRGQTPKRPLEADWYTRVAAVAYRIYVARGRTPGHEIDDWLAAERMLLSDPIAEEPDDGDAIDGKIT